MNSLSSVVIGVTSVLWVWASLAVTLQLAVEGSEIPRWVRVLMILFAPVAVGTFFTLVIVDLVREALK